MSKGHGRPGAGISPGLHHGGLDSGRYDVSHALLSPGLVWWLTKLIMVVDTSVAEPEAPLPKHM